jgi:hypothetical protein
MHEFRALEIRQATATKYVTAKIGSVLKKKTQNRTGKLGFGSNPLISKHRTPPRNPFPQFL